MLKVIVYFILVLSLFSNEKIILATDEYEPIYGSHLKNNGFFSKISYEAFRKEGISLELNFFPWKRAYMLAKDGRYDGLLGALYFKEREKYFIYSDPVFEIDIVIIAKKNKIPKFQNLSHLKDYRLSVVRAYHHSDEFDNINFSKKFESASIEDCVNLLLNGRVDIIAGPKLVILNYIKKRYPNKIDSIEEIAVIDSKPLHILISRRKENAKYYIEKFNKGLENIKRNGVYAEILNEYLSQ